MSEPFIGEIRLLPFSFAPRNWLPCDGRLIPIAQNTALFSILGTTYGGNGQSNFALPDLRGRSPVHWGQGPGLQQYELGEASGTSTVTLLATEMPMHNHLVSAVANVGNSNTPGSATLAQSSIRSDLYAGAGSANTTMAPTAVTVAGSSGAHNNMPPYLVMGFFIATAGVFPVRN